MHVNRRAFTRVLFITQKKHSSYKRSESKYSILLYVITRLEIIFFENE